MTVDRCSSRLEDLRDMLNFYKRLYDDPYKALYRDEAVKKMMNSTYKEVLRLEDLMYNDELEDSYDQNTGEYHVEKRRRD